MTNFLPGRRQYITPVFLTSPIFIAEVRKPPDIGQVHRKPDDGQQKIHLLLPSFSLFFQGHHHCPRGNDGKGGRSGGTTPTPSYLPITHHLLIFLVILFNLSISILAPDDLPHLHNFGIGKMFVSWGFVVVIIILGRGGGRGVPPSKTSSCSELHLLI